MNPEEINPEMGTSPEMAQQGDLTPEDAKAALGNASYLVEQMLMSQAQPMMEEMPQEQPQEQPQEEPEMEHESPEEMEKKMDEKIESKVTEIVQKELSSFKEDLMKALDDEEE